MVGSWRITKGSETRVREQQRTSRAKRWGHQKEGRNLWRWSEALGIDVGVGMVLRMKGTRRKIK